MQFNGSSAVDPYFLNETSQPFPVPSYNAFSTKTQVDPRLDSGRNLILVTIGQSNSINIAPSAYTPVNVSIDNLNILNGGVYTATDPLLGTNHTPAAGVGNYALRLADKLRTAGTADRVILVPIAYPATVVADWGAGGSCNHRIAVASRRMMSLGYTPSAWIWQQGETDNTSGTSQAGYTIGLNSMIATIRNYWTSSVPIFVCKCSWAAGAVSANVQNAQVAAVDHGNGIWAGADGDSLNNTYRQDTTHWNDTGSDTFAGLVKTALAAYGAPFV